MNTDYKDAKFNGEVTIADGANAALSGGSFAKLTVEGDKTCAEGGIEYHYGDIAKYAFEASDNRVFSRLDNPGKINDNSPAETVAQ